MFKNFLKVAFRNVSRRKGFSLINIAGLTLGMAACLLIGLFVQDEYSYDKFMPGATACTGYTTIIPTITRKQTAQLRRLCLRQH
jgi:hypothetical protein